MVRHTDFQLDRAPCGGVVLAAALLASASGALAQERGVAPAPTGPVVVLEADNLVQDDEAQVIIAEGSVEARYDGRTLRASRVIYDTRARTVRAQGGVEIINPDGSVQYADEIEVDDELNTGLAIGFGARTPQGATLAADAAIRRPDGATGLRRAVYTACPVCAEGGPTWTLRARNAEQDLDSKLITYRGVTLQVHGVPVIYLPYFAHPDPTAGRRSGFLAPDVGQNRRVGLFYQQPYYWAISPSQDLTIAPQFHEQVNPLVAFEYRKRFWSGQVEFNGSGSYDQDFGSEGEKFGEETFRGHLFGEGSFTINDYWGWRFGIENATDDLYLARYDIEDRDQRRGLYKGNTSRLITQLNVLGQDETSFTQISAFKVQGLRLEDDSSNLPLALPFGEAQRLFRDPVFDGLLKVTASTANVVRTEGGRDSLRASVGARWRKEAIVGPGLVVSPFAEARGDYYQITEGDTGDETLQRGVGVAGAEVRLPLVRPGENVTWLVEPIALVALGSNGGNDERIPNEDSLAFEVDETSIFRAIATPNYDLWEPGPRAAVGVRASARLEAGAEARVVVGRRWREEADTRFNAASNLNGTSSDYVGAVALDFGAPLYADVRFRLDEDDLGLTRIDTTLASTVGPVAASARYYKVEETLRPGAPNEEVTAGLDVTLSRHWSVGTGIRRDLNLDKNLSNTARLTYRDDCTFVEFSYERSETDERLGPSEGFRIRVGLATLGTFGGS